MDDAAFETLAEQTIERFAERIEAACELDVEVEGGILTIETDSGETYLLNKHAPLKQLWLSSPVSGASHYRFDPADQSWVSTREGDPLEQLLSAELSAVAGTPVTLA